MPLRFPCLQLSLSVGGVLRPYWPNGVMHYPGLDAFAVARGSVLRVPATGIDTRSDYVLFGSDVARALGLSLPLPRQAPFSGAAGTQAGVLSFPPDGLVGLFVTDYTEYCYLPSPLVAFHPPSPNPQSQRSVLGLTAF